MLIPMRRKAPVLDIADAFSTDLYTGTESTHSITNGIDLDGEGGMVWIKNRDSAQSHKIIDSERGWSGSDGYAVETNSTSAQAAETGLSAFNSNGYTITGLNGAYNAISEKVVGWSFRKAENFFDVVTYTGTGSAQNISHSLGSAPGMIIVKRTDLTGYGWNVYHRSNTANPETDYLLLNATNATADYDGVWDDTAPTSTQFTVGTETDVNASGGSYVAYVFAHDTTDNGVIQCGSYTGNGSTSGPTVTLGWEPQWVMIKRTDSTGSWMMFDAARGMGSGTDPYLSAEGSYAEATGSQFIEATATGFQLKTTSTTVNASGGTYVYMAIRKEGV